MKTCINNLFRLPALIFGLGLTLKGQMTAQTFTTLHNFTALSNSPPYGNSEGTSPYGRLVWWGNTMFGTAARGGSSGTGTVFRVNTDGTGFTNLHSFTGNDGASPYAGLALSGNTLYGTTFAGGSSGRGTVFAVYSDGTGFTNLHSFTGGDGFDPTGLIVTGSTLYGTAAAGGSSGNGTVFRLNTGGTAFTNLYSFTATSPPNPLAPNSDGAYPNALVLSGSTIYGTAASGGSSGYGTVFRINTDGTGFTNLHSFAGGDGSDPTGLILAGGSLYGTTFGGGSGGSGTVFSMNTDGTGFTNLHRFTATSLGLPQTNSDGAYPYAGLIISDNTLYGTATSGGSSGNGTVFAVNTNGKGFAVLHSFPAATDPFTGSGGANPYSGLILAGKLLYGTTINGGSSSNGTVFSLGLSENDACSQAITISSSSYSNTQSTAGATYNPAPNCVDDFGSGVWYKFIPPSNGQLVLDTIGSDFDTGLAIYTGDCRSYNLVACDDDGGGNLSSKITVSLTAGIAYYILAGGYAGETGNLVLHSAFTPTAPPADLGIQLQGTVAMLTMIGSVKATYLLEYSTNLHSWTVLTNLTLTESPYLFYEVTSGNRPMTFYRMRLRGPAVPEPKIGWVDFRVPPAIIVSILRTGSSFVFNNDVTIAILGTDGTETHFTSGPTPSSPANDNIPYPSSTVGSTPPNYFDGMFPEQVPPSIILPQPDVTVKAIGFESGLQSSLIVSTRFQFRAAGPSIQGTNAASFKVFDDTIGAQMWYTTDASDPTNAPPSVGPIAGSQSGVDLSINSPSNFTFKIRAFRHQYQPSDVVSKTFSGAP